MDRKIRGSTAIGIDLGTTYSCVAYWKHDRVEIIPNDQGNRITPSYVAFTDSERLVGDAAFNQVAQNPANTVFDAKRMIGRKFSDDSVQCDMKLWPFKVISSGDDRPIIHITHKGEEKEFAAEEISAMVLAKMKEIAEKYIGSEVKNAVVTIPAYFEQSQRQATIDAANIAGLNVLNIINEPTAAAIAYGLQNSSRIKKKRTVLVFDLGGGTFDVAILTMKKNSFEVKAIAGDTHLGGEDFDNRMVRHYIEEFKKKHNKDVSGNPKSLRRLRTACEKAKRILSAAAETRIDIDALFEGIDFSARVTRPKFEELNLDLFNKCIEIVQKCIMDAKMRFTDVDDIVLVGGSSRIPKVQQLLQNILMRRVHCDSINPDEAVAYGAAIQAAKLTRQKNSKVRNLVLVEVTPLSLGIGVEDCMNVLIPRNTIIPTRKKWEGGFTTMKDNQTEASVNVYEGERLKASENKLLGTFVISGIEMAPRGVPWIDVYFDLQANGVLIVSAKNKSTGKKTSITVTSGELSGLEREVMIEEANKYKHEDEKHVMKTNARLDFDAFVCSMRDKIRKKSMPFDEKKKAEDAIEKAFQWMDAEKELAGTFDFAKKTKELKLIIGDTE